MFNTSQRHFSDLWESFPGSLGIVKRRNPYHTELKLLHTGLCRRLNQQTEKPWTSRVAHTAVVMQDHGQYRSMDPVGSLVAPSFGQSVHANGSAYSSGPVGEVSRHALTAPSPLDSHFVNSNVANAWHIFTGTAQMMEPYMLFAEEVPMPTRLLRPRQHGSFTGSPLATPLPTSVPLPSKLGPIGLRAPPSDHSVGCPLSCGNPPMKDHAAPRAAARVKYCSDHPLVNRRSSSELTLVVRHLPECLQEQLLQIWDPKQYHFDFLFLPYFEKRRHHFTYCFISFPDLEAASTFHATWSNRFLPLGKGGEKALDIRIADVQGFQNNMLTAFAHLAKSRRKPQHLPAVFDRFGVAKNFRQALAEVSKNGSSSQLSL